MLLFLSFKEWTHYACVKRQNENGFGGCALGRHHSSRSQQCPRVSTTVPQEEPMPVPELAATP
jgi:hypothetical protein